MVKLKLAGAKAIGVSAPKKKRLSCGRTSLIDEKAWTYIGTEGNTLRVFARVREEDDDIVPLQLLTPHTIAEQQILILREQRTVKRTVAGDIGSGLPTPTIQAIVEFLSGENSDSEDSVAESEEEDAESSPVASPGKELLKRELELARRELELEKKERASLVEGGGVDGVASGGRSAGSSTKSAANYEAFLRRRPEFKAGVETVAKYRERFDDWLGMLKKYPQFDTDLVAYSFRTETPELKACSAGTTIPELLKKLEDKEYVNEESRLGAQMKTLVKFPDECGKKTTTNLKEQIEDMDRAMSVKMPKPFLGWTLLEARTKKESDAATIQSSVFGMTAGSGLALESVEAALRTLLQKRDLELETVSDKILRGATSSLPVLAAAELEGTTGKKGKLFTGWEDACGKAGVCRNMYQHGKCSWGSRCKFKHDTALVKEGWGKGWQKGHKGGGGDGHGPKGKHETVNKGTHATTPPATFTLRKREKVLLAAMMESMQAAAGASPAPSSNQPPTTNTSHAAQADPGTSVRWPNLPSTLPIFQGGMAVSLADLKQLQLAGLLTSATATVADGGCTRGMGGLDNVLRYLGEMEKLGLVPAWRDCSVPFGGIGGGVLCRREVTLVSFVGSAMTVWWCAIVEEGEGRKLPVLAPRPLLYNVWRITHPVNEGKNRLTWASEPLGISAPGRALPVSGGMFIFEMFQDVELFRDRYKLDLMSVDLASSAVETFDETISAEHALLAPSPLPPLTKEELQIMHHNLGYPPFKRFWAMVRKRDPSDTTRAVVEGIVGASVAQQGHHKKPHAKLQTNPDLIPEEPMDTGTMDFFFLLGTWYLLFVNMFSHFRRLHRCVGSPSSAEALNCLLSLRMNGHLTRKMLTDMDPSFTSKIWQRTCQVLKVRHFISPSQSHWSCGLSERSISMLKYLFWKLRRSPAFDGFDDFQVLCFALCALNEMCSEALAGASPFYVELARHPISTELVHENPISHASMQFQLQTRELARRAAHDMIVDVSFGRLLASKADPNRPVLSPESGNLVDYYDENVQDYIGPASVIGPAPGPDKGSSSEKRFFVQCGGRTFHKATSQLRSHLTTEELDFPSCIRELSDELVAENPVLLSLDRAAAILDSVDISSSEPMAGGFLAITTSLSPEQKTLVAATRALEQEEEVLKVNRKPTREEAQVDFPDADAAEFGGLTDPKRPVVERITGPEARKIRREHKCTPALQERRYKGDGRRKTRICVMGTKKHDPRREDPDFATFSPTMTREVMRLLLFLCLVMGFLLTSFDVIQAFLESDPFAPNEPPVFLLPPKDDCNRGFWSSAGDEVWRLLRPLYGLADSGRRWWTCFDKEVLAYGLVKDVYDRAFFWLPDPSPGKDGGLGPLGFLGMHVDDGLAAGGRRFATRVLDSIAKRFPCKFVFEQVKEFAGVAIEWVSDAIHMHQTAYIDTELAEERTGDQASCAPYVAFRRLLGKLGWVTATRPSIMATLSTLAAVTVDACDWKHVKQLNKVVRFLKATRKVVWKLVKLPLRSFVILAYTDASLNNLDAEGAAIRTQGGFCIFLAEQPKRFGAAGRLGRKIPRGEDFDVESLRANLVYVQSKRIRRVTQSTLAAETIQLVLALDRVISLRLFLEKMLARTIPVYLCTDCASLRDALANDGRTTSKRLQVDLEAIQEAIDSGLIDHIAHCPSALNYADETTKVKGLGDSLLEKAMSECRVDVAV